MEVPWEAATAAVAGLLGLLMGGAIGEWRATRAEDRVSRRARDSTVIAGTQARLRDTRLTITNQLAALEAVSLGDVKEAKRRSLAVDGLDSDICLAGNAGAVLAYRDLVIELRSRFGRGLPPQYAARSAVVLADVISALDEQEERLLRGEQIHRLNREEVPQLFDTSSLVADLRLPRRLPSPAAVQARTVIDVLAWIERRRFGRRRQG